MTFLEQQDLLSRFLGDSNTSSQDLWPADDRKFELNRGEKQFAKDSKSLLRYSTSTVSSSAISLPSGFFELHALIVNSKKFTKRREISVAELERYTSGDWYYFWANSSGTRQLNFIDSSQDGQTYKMFYFGLPTTDLSADSDESPLEDQYREGPVHYAAGKLLLEAGKTQLAEYHFSKYDQIVNEADIETRRLYKDDIEVEPDVGQQFETETDRANSVGSI